MLITGDRRLTTAPYDGVIVGAGPVGLTMALDMAQAGRRVLVVETAHGGVDCGTSVAYGHYGGGYWNAHTIRALGGTSTVWSGWCTTLQPIDFDNPAVGRAWPVSRESAAPIPQ